MIAIAVRTEVRRQKERAGRTLSWLQLVRALEARSHIPANGIERTNVIERLHGRLLDDGVFQFEGASAYHDPMQSSDAYILVEDDPPADADLGLRREIVYVPIGAAGNFVIDCRDLFDLLEEADLLTVATSPEALAERFIEAREPVLWQNGQLRITARICTPFNAAPLLRRTESILRGRIPSDGGVPGLDERGIECMFSVQRDLPRPVPLIILPFQRSANALADELAAIFGA